MKTIIHTDKAPKAVGPYSQAVEVSGTLFLSGQVPINPAIGKLVDGGIAEQTNQVLDNIAAILAEAGLTFDNIVKTTCFLTDLGDFQEFNSIYATRFTEKQPARSTIEISKLPLGAKVEIECIAVR
jgi:2-iminobutanoate/2-iminopropanoate deaminase